MHEMLLENIFLEGTNKKPIVKRNATLLVKWHFNETCFYWKYVEFFTPSFIELETIRKRFPGKSYKKYQNSTVATYE